MRLKIPVTLVSSKITPAQQALIEAAQKILAEAAAAAQNDDIDPDTGLGQWLKGKKSYIVMVLTIASAGLGIYSQAITLPEGVATILAALGFGAHRSALKTQTETIKTAVVKAVTSEPPPGNHYE